MERLLGQLPTPSQVSWKWGRPADIFLGASSPKGYYLRHLGALVVKQSAKSTYSDLCQRKTQVWEHLHLFSIPHICCRMHVYPSCYPEITFVANSLPIVILLNLFIIQSFIWGLKDGDSGVPAVVTFCSGLNSGPASGILWRVWTFLELVGKSWMLLRAIIFGETQ